MTTIDLSKPITEPPQLTVLSYGPSRSGKTWFGATFPDPLFLSDKVEGGYVTIQGMPKEEFYDKPPVIEVVSCAAEMRSAIERYKPDIAAGRFKTVLVDSLTFYAESFVTEMESKFTNGQQFWGVYSKHIGWLQNNLHATGANVVWLALPRDGEDGKMGGPLLQGRQKELVPARCNTMIYHRSKQVGKTSSVYEAHLQPFGKYPAGIRAGVRNSKAEKPLTSPIENATYKKLMTELGWKA